MKDLLTQARSTANTGSKKTWTMEATLALIVLKGRGATTKEIAEATKHPANSVTYRFNRWCSKFETFNAILTHYEIQDHSIEDIEQIVDQYLKETAAA